MEILEKYEDVWPTDKGAWFPGEKVLFRQLDLFKDFTDKSWMTLLLYGVTGKIFNKKESELLEELWKISTSFPDPRLWNNRVAALAGTARSTGNLALAAGTAVSEATIYGRRPDIRVSEFLQQTLKRQLAEDELTSYILDYLKSHRTIPGFGRPIVSNDERIIPLVSQAEKLGLANGEHLALVWKIEGILKQKRLRIKANISSVCAALTADLGLSPREFYWYALLSFSVGILTCYVDAHEKPEGAFFPLRTDRINYKGKETREWVGT